jgi:hypothetical protein
MNITTWSRAAMLLLVLGLAFGAINVHACSATQQDVFLVGNKAIDSACNYDTIQDAINASTCSAGTKIYLTAERTYTAQHLGISNKNISLVGRGATSRCDSQSVACGILVPCPTNPLQTISGHGHTGDSVITIRGASNVTLQYLTISDGKDASDGSGGGIDYDGTGTLTIDTSSISDNEAGYGGGINLKGSNGHAELHIQSNTVILANTADVSGGGVRIEGDARLIMAAPRSTISANSAASFGGGIEILGPARADIAGSVYNTVAANSAANGGGIAVYENGNGRALLRVFNLDPSDPTQIYANTATDSGGGIYVHGLSDVCMFSPRVDNNEANEGAAIYEEGSGGIYINDHFPDRLGPDCGPEPVSELGGIEECLYAAQCNRFDGNTARGTAQTPGSILYHNNGELVGSRFRIQHNTGGHAIGSIYGGTIVTRCLVTDNTVSGSLISDAEWGGGTTDFKACTFAHNAIGGDAVFDFTHQNAISLSYDIIAEPGHPSVDFFPYDPNDTMSIGYVISNDITTLPHTNNPGVVADDPLFIDPASGDYHLRNNSPALDFAPQVYDQSLDCRLGNSIDLPVMDKFGTADLGPYELISLDRIFASGVGDPVRPLDCYGL